MLHRQLHAPRSAPRPSLGSTELERETSGAAAAAAEEEEEEVEPQESLRVARWLLLSWRPSARRHGKETSKKHHQGL